MSSELVNLSIDGIPVSVQNGTTILDAAAAAGIEIPTLCFLKELGPYGACGVCLVEIEGSPRLLRACSAKVAEGMKVLTGSERVAKARKLALDLLMGDHDGDCIGPCRLNCPAHTDCQKYVREISEGKFREAVDTVKEQVPLPASIGRVCPHPCEKACRRRLVEEPISIAALKAFAADWTLAHPTASPAPAPTLKRLASGEAEVGIVGGGPAGLAAAYRLANLGHSVTIYDKMPEMGGMLRWGIPEYRLPKQVLKAETDAIAALGVEFRNNFTLGRDATINDLRARHAAVLVANGAWRSSSIHCPGEKLEGVWGGIDFLREIALGHAPNIGKRTAIVGGGNTAMDACRSAVRLGADEVYVIYRRTRAEMPAEAVEIAEAEEEGVAFKFLANPAEILGADGKVRGVKLQTMELAAPDERGRRRPVPVEGAFTELELDSIIIAAGQKNDPAGFEDIPLTERGTIAADPKTFATTLSGVFAAGDAVNDGASIAIKAIAAANNAALSIDAFLRGGELPSFRDPVVSERHPTEKDYTEEKRLARVVMPQRPAAERRKDFGEVNLGLSESAAMAEAKRCLQCGCHDYADCRLIRYANKFEADCNRLRGEFHPGFVERRLQTIERNQRKCILCNLCVRICEGKARKGILGLVGRGFSTVIKPEFDTEAAIAGCAECHLCVDSCPTGALKLIERG